MSDGLDLFSTDSEEENTMEPICQSYSLELKIVDIPVEKTPLLVNTKKIEHKGFNGYSVHPQLRNNLLSFPKSEKILLIQDFPDCLISYNTFTKKKEKITSFYNKYTSTAKTEYSDDEEDLEFNDGNPEYLMCGFIGINKDFIVSGTSTDFKEKRTFIIEQRKNGDVYKGDVLGGYRWNDVAIVGNESQYQFHFVGQTKIYAVYEINLKTNHELKLKNSSNIQSYGNAITLSKTKKYIGIATDDVGFYIYRNEGVEDNFDFKVHKNMKDEVYEDLMDNIDFNADDTVLAVSSSTNIFLYKIPSFEYWKNFNTANCSMCKFSPNNKKYLASYISGSLYVDPRKSGEFFVVDVFSNEKIFQEYLVDFTVKMTGVAWKGGNRVFVNKGDVVDEYFFYSKGELSLKKKLFATKEFKNVKITCIF